MYSHGITRDTFAFVPSIDLSKRWTDAKLNKRYGLTQDEIDFIKSKIRPMEADSTGKESKSHA
jgi:site-specific DNA-methyltransferase (adenine-specific)